MYVDINYDKDKEVIHVVERVNGIRVFKDYDPDYHFFINDAKGTHTTMFGNPVKRINPKTRKELYDLKNDYNGITWESDIRPQYRCLEQEYKDAEYPKLHVAFFDIETSWYSDTGAGEYSPASVARNPIISISLYLQWMETMVCIAVPPPTMTFEQAEEIAREVGDTIIVKTEYEMLDMFLDLVEDADILSGWNSSLYDIPYVTNRIIKKMGKLHAKRLCLWNKLPEQRDVIFGGKAEMSYNLFGRVHLDYMELYKNFNTEEKSSYSLENIAAEEELGENKVKYVGSLESLYRDEFKRFLEYNIQDTNLLNLLDKKRQYISLANSMAHVNCIPIPAVMGAVGMTEQAIVMEAHRLGFVVPDKKKIDENDKTSHRAAGGWVSHPKVGYHNWVGSSDLNSLYPSVIRALNMSNETIVGQLRTDMTNQSISEWESAKSSNSFSDWWNDRFSTLEMENFFNNDNSELLWLDMANDTEIQVTGAELRKLVFECGNNWCISANGTIFDTTKMGVIPTLLTRWYNERKSMKKCMNMYESLVINEKVDGVKIPDSICTNDDIDYDKHQESDCYNMDTAYSSIKLKKLVDDNDRDAVIEYLSKHRLTIIDGKVHHNDQSYIYTIIEFWDKRQHVRKILLNSLYGGLLNKAHRFFDQRLGQSTTLTGRCITRHMSAKTNEFFTGVYDHKGQTIIYNDTDSVYFSAYEAFKPKIESGEINWSVENIIYLYDEISKMVNDTFSQFMLETFNVPAEYGKVIAAAREVVAKSAIFIRKKRYAALVIDKEGIRQDIGGKTGKLKVTGLDLRRNDTIKPIQVFLKDVLMLLLDGNSENDIMEYMIAYKKEFVNTDPWTWGAATKANNLTNYMRRREEELELKLSGYAATKGFTIPAQITGALNWNELRDIHHDNESVKITDGMKIIRCFVLNTPDNPYREISYPVDELRLPQWFLELPFDREKMITAAFDKKVENMLGFLGWDLSRLDIENENFENMYVYDDDDC